MKRIILSILLLSSLQTFASNPDPVNLSDWQKAGKGYWFGKIGQQSYWYYLDENGQAWRTANGRNWEACNKELGKTPEGQLVRLSSSGLEVGPGADNNWNPAQLREWSPSNGYGYVVEMKPIIWEFNGPKL